MTAAILLLLPLVAGYVFCQASFFTRFTVSREEGHRLYFRAVFYGVVLLVIGIFIRMLLIARCGAYENLEQSLLEIIADQAFTLPDNLSPFFVLACIYSVALSPAMVLLSNALIWLFGLKSWFLRRAIQYDDLERILFDAQQDEIPISLTIANRKVYIGFPLESPDPHAAGKSISLMPLISGYRDKDTLKLVLTTDYIPIYDKAKTASQKYDEFRLVIPVDQVVSIGFFDFVAYKQFQNNRSRTSKRGKRDVKKRENMI